MRLRSSIAGGVLVLWAAQALAVPPDYFGIVEPPKPEKKVEGTMTPASPSVARVGGEDFANATPIGALPYTDGGSTCGFRNDYYPSCAFAGNSTAPDVVYVYRPQVNTCIRVSACGSGYDTILHVYANNPATMIACNDDDCGLQSVVDNVQLTAGSTYYIVVDGYSSACGTYTLTVEECPLPCAVPCPPGAIAEGEPACGTGYVDAYNGGCNSTPPAFTRLACNELGVQVCGQYGTYGTGTRDTDWYEIRVQQPSVIEYCVTGEYPTQIAVIDGNGGCPIEAADILCGSFYADECEQVCCTIALNPGTYWLFVATDGFTGFPCVGDYVLRLTGYNCPPVGVESVQWSRVKRLYRDAGQ